jgi:hypothetical protein
MKTLCFFVVLLVGICAPVSAAEPVEFSVGAFVFDRPEGWNWITATSPMRKAQLAVKGDGGATADVVFFHFGPGQGGTVEANVQRWIGQFQDAKSSSRKETVGTMSVTFVEAEGTFLSGMPGTPALPMEGFAMRGAIIESPEGDVYAKLTGPKALVESASAAFEAMIKGAKASAPAAN